MNRSDNIGDLAVALLQAQKNMGAALKDAKNPFFKSSYADLNAVIDASVPALNESGVSVLQLVSSDGAGSVVETILMHTSGQFISSSTPVVCAKANDPQALGSAISYARRYGLQAMVTLKAEDNDAEGAMNRGPSTAKVTTTATKTLPEAVTTAAAAPAKGKPSFSKKSVAVVETAPVTLTSEDDL